MIEIEYDLAKSVVNIKTRDLSFEQARDFDFNSALIGIDWRRNYGETRYVALGYLGGRLHVLCFTESATGIRVISFRKANIREANYYVLQTTH